TMRGEPILETRGEVTSSSETKGLEWGYAMQWSQGTMDVMSSLIPGIVGGSGQEPVSKSSAIAKFMRGTPNPKAPLYWGSLPFTSGPPYLGAGIVFLFVLGLFLVKGKMKWWLGIATLLMILISMGRHFEFLNRIFFDYFPLFNNFRAPNSVMAVGAVFLPILGALGVQRILNKEIDGKEFKTALYWSAGITGGLCLFFALFGSSFFDFTAAVDAQYQQAASALVEDRKSLMQSDSFRSFIIIAIAAGLLWAYYNNKVKSTVLFVGLGLLFTVDLTMVGKRYLDNDSFVTERQYEQNFAPRQVDQQIMQDPDLYYRVLDLSINTFNSAQSSYFHKTIGGYHAAKLQRYQDMIDYHITKGNQQVLNMLNTKYIINKEEKAQLNQGAMGNGWFVGNIQLVDNANKEIEALSNFDPATTAVVHKEFESYVNGLNGAGTGTVSLTNYAPNKLTYTVNSSADQLAVFSEIWYGPNKGWKAYIDGNEAPHIRVDYCLRGLKIPSGQHEVIFEFNPESFQKGETISYISSSILLLAFLGLFGFKGYQWFNELPEDGTEETQGPKPTKKKK
ncbi:MAG: YfhO family protein, partial [Saprospiraceae bacterium]|nr:YfhO family protein [Saprospiraceae bacterium]